MLKNTGTDTIKNNKVPEGIYTYLIEVVGEDYKTYNRYGSVNVIY